MCGNIMMDRIRNHEFREKLGVAILSAKMQENMLRWVGHMQSKTHDAPVRLKDRMHHNGGQENSRLRIKDAGEQVDCTLLYDYEQPSFFPPKTLIIILYKRNTLNMMMITTKLILNFHVFHKRIESYELRK